MITQKIYSKLKYLIKSSKNKKNIIDNNYVPVLFVEGFVTWDEAKSNSIGYDSDLILEKCFNSIMKVIDGKSVYERDSVLFDKKEYSIGVISSLFLAAKDNQNKLTIMDFGGSFGSTYFQNAEFFSFFDSVKWGVVEQTNFYKIAKEEVENENLLFFDSYQKCMEQICPKLILISSSLQYLENPDNFLNILNNSFVDYIVFDRTPFSVSENFITVQTVPETIYKASYPCWIFNKDWLLRILSNYEIINEFPSYCDPIQLTNQGKEIFFSGFILKCKK